MSSRIPDSHAWPLAPGGTLGGYRLLAEVARGGMGVVWAARAIDDRRQHPLVAIKTLLPWLAADPRFSRMFEAEVRIHQKIRHRNVCAVLDSGKDGELPYLVMEWLDGESLATLLSDARGPLPYCLAVRIVLDVARGLEVAHELAASDGKPLGVVHRDVSPQNVFVGSDGNAKILDFGVAKVQASDQNLTQAGYLKGKVGYMSPEQVFCEDVDGRSDVFALGVVLYEATTQRHPFAAGGELGTIVNISSAEPAAPPQTIVSDYPESLSRVVMVAIDKDPSRRFPSMREFKTALEQLSEEFPSNPGATSRYLAQICGHRRRARTRALISASPRPVPHAGLERREPRRSVRPAGWLIGVSAFVVSGIVGSLVPATSARPPFAARPMPSAAHAQVFAPAAARPAPTEQMAIASIDPASTHVPSGSRPVARAAPRATSAVATAHLPPRMGILETRD